MSSAAETLSDTSWTDKAEARVDPATDSGLQALIVAARLLDIPCSAEQSWHVHGKTAEPFDEWDILRVARRLGLRARASAVKAARLRVTPLPALLQDSETGAYHVLTAVSDTEAGLLEPISGRTSTVSLGDLTARFGSRMILLSRAVTDAVAPARFGIGWFLPSILKHVARFRKVVIASLLIQAFALLSPMLFQVVIDRVLVSRGLQSLDVLAIGLVGIALFDPLMGFFRSVTYSHIASCVNSDLSSRLFRHLLHLPISYFGARQSGDIIARVRELDHIRQFLTGSALMMVLDLAFVGVFIAVMFGYAADLAWLVLGSLAVYLLLWTAIAPFLRSRVERQFERNADNTAFLTETVTGMETVKSLAVGRRFQREWEDRLASYLRASLRTNMLGNWAGGGIGLVQKLLTALVLWFGVQLVLSGELTVGQLVAFNMLSGHVTMPILRLAQVWQDFQHTGVSIKRIGDILNEPTEAIASAGKSSLDEVHGRVELRKVTFRYSDDGAEVLRRLDLTVSAGEKIGITGLSGSGKSTITKLIQRFYVPYSGQVLIDGVDLAMADPAMLRRRMGIVLQESFLFNGSVRENIALGDPRAAPEDIDRAAKLAGAHDFISTLPNGYDTPVGERGGALSGGQRQRIAIARALVSDPSILIFDEATSALDYEAEAAIMAQLPQILEGRTTIMIAHRLNTMRFCDRILVLEKGEIIEEGTHDALVEAGGRYAELWRLQNA
ncbi:MAG: type I secretion system permease/ATPase [Nitratireductor sp.]